MQLYAVNFISLLRSLYMFRVPYTPIIRIKIFQLYLQPLVQTLVPSELLAPSVAWYKIANDDGCIRHPKHVELK